jgi:hypothetical protein
MGANRLNGSFTRIRTRLLSLVLEKLNTFEIPKSNQEARGETVAKGEIGRGAAMIKLTFKQTDSEIIVRAAATVLFSTLVRRDAKLVSISDLAEKPQYGFTASAATEPVGPKFVRITDLQDGRIDWESVPFCECPKPDNYLLRDDDILFARTGATTGKTHLVRNAENAVFASYLIRIRPKPDVFASYLHAFFQSDNYWTQISEEKEGSAQPNVNGEKLASLQIPIVDSKLQHAIAEFLRCVRRRQDGEKIELPELPSPLAEQRRVVARIEELAAQIHEARTLRHQAAEEAEALYPQQLGEAMTPHGEGWKRETVADVIRSMDAGWSPQCDDIPAKRDGWGVLKTTSVQWCDFQPQHNKALPQTLAPILGLTVKVGDVLVTSCWTAKARSSCCGCSPR